MLSPNKWNRKDIVKCPFLIIERAILDFSLFRQYPSQSYFPLGSGNIISSHKRMWKYPITLKLLYFIFGV